MRKITSIAIITLIAALPTTAIQGLTPLDSLEYGIRAGYSIGGTTPVGMPSTIRELNKFTPKASVLIAADAHLSLDNRWGLMLGLAFEGKHMSIDATVKNYHMEIVRGGESLEGYFTGRNSTEVRQWMFTIPLMATYDLSGKLRLRAGPYLSVLTASSFEGYAYDGYLRVDTPTGAKVDLGRDAGTRGSYDFSGDMRRMQYGVRVGVDWLFLRPWGLFADLSWGLTGIHNSRFDTIEQTLYPIYGTIGIMYKLN